MKSIYVGNLSFGTTEEQLRELFSAHGAVGRVSIIKDRYTGESRGFAFIDMQDDNEALAAVTALNGAQLDGRSLKVNEARPQEARGPRGGEEFQSRREAGSRGGERDQ